MSELFSIQLQNRQQQGRQKEFLLREPWLSVRDVEERPLL